MKYNTYIELLLTNSIPSYMRLNKAYSEYVEMIREYYNKDKYTRLVYDKHYKNLDSYLLHLEVNRLIPNLPTQTALRKDKICHFTSDNISNINNIKIIKGITGKETQIIDNNQLILATSDNEVISNTSLEVKGVYDNEFITINGNEIRVNSINYKYIGDYVVSVIEVNENITHIETIDNVELHASIKEVSVNSDLKDNNYNVFDSNNKKVGTITINRSQQIGDISVVSLDVGYSLNERIIFPELEDFDAYVSLMKDDKPFLISFNKLGRTNLSMPAEIEHKGIKVKITSKIASIDNDIVLVNSRDLHVLENNIKVKLNIKTGVTNKKTLLNKKGLTSGEVCIFNGAEYGANGITIRNGDSTGTWIDYSKQSNTHAFSNVVHEIIEIV